MALVSKSLNCLRLIFEMIGWNDFLNFNILLWKNHLLPMFVICSFVGWSLYVHNKFNKYIEALWLGTFWYTNLCGDDYFKNWRKETD